MEVNTDIEQLLYEHAVRTSIRPPWRERLTLLGYNRVVSGGMAATMALCAAFAFVGASNVGPVVPSANQITRMPEAGQPVPAPDVSADQNDQPRQVASVIGQAGL